MEQKRENCTCRAPRFRPRLEGCVARDRHMAAALEVCYVDAFASVAANVYRSLVTAEADRGLSETYEWIAEEALEEFRTLGELILALGGDAMLRQSRRVRPCASSSDTRFLRACRAECERSIDRYETLMSRTGDRVVRSVLAGLLSGQRRIAEKIMRLDSEKSC
ncbi:MAG: hypothetical protein IJW29_05200 [Clostridia bacterium]|nr:hypothetical protein [Clostridia bacterium]